MNHNTQCGWVSEVISGAPHCEQGPVENWSSYLVNDSSVFNYSFSANYDKVHFLHDVAKCSIRDHSEGDTEVAEGFGHLLTW